MTLLSDTYVSLAGLKPFSHQEYNMDMYHVSGKRHEDALSRLGYLRQMYEETYTKDKEEVKNIKIDTTESIFSHVQRQMYSYCPTWALDWQHRKEMLLKEIMQCNADIVCLQVRVWGWVCV